MFKFFVQRLFFFCMFLAAVGAFLGVFYYALYTEEESKRPEHYASPFGEASGKAIVDPTQDKNLLSVQHMSAGELGGYLPSAIANALTFNQTNYKSVVADSEKYFTPEGYVQYVQFLTGANIEQALVAQDLQAGAFAEEEPLNINHGVFDGVYKWVFEVPVTLSFTPRSAEGDIAAQGQPLNRRFVLRAQMARVNDPKFPQSVKIELWQVLPPRAQK